MGRFNWKSERNIVFFFLSLMLVIVYDQPYQIS